MKLYSLHLQNFCCFKDYMIEPKGKNITLYGTNGAGKTTFCNAITWLLYNKDLEGAQLDPKPEGQHKIVTSVEGVFTLDNGSRIALTKEYKEIWQKKRGSSIESFTGNTTDHYIDGVPISKTEFDNRMESLCPQDKIQILTNPLFFAEQMHWKERRSLLLEVCGDISDEDVISENTDLQKLLSFLAKPGSDVGTANYSIDEYKAIAVSQMKNINDQLKEIPARIDEATKAMPDISGLDEKVLRQRQKDINAEIVKLSAEESNLSVNETVQLVRVEIAKIETEIGESRMAYKQKYDDGIQELREQKNKIQEELSALKSKITKLTHEKWDTEHRLEKTMKLRGELSAEYNKAKTSDWVGETVCPTCQRDLPEEGIEEAKAAFNQKKSKDMEAIRNRVEKECSKDVLSEINAEINSLAAEYDALQNAKKLKEKELAELERNMPELTPFEETDEYAALQAKKLALQEKIKCAEKTTEGQRDKLQQSIDKLQEELDEAGKSLLKLASVASQKERIGELDAEERRLSAEFERLQEGIYLCELFYRTKVDLLDERINSKFKTIKFKLFEQQNNGGISETCEPSIPCKEGLIDFSKANSAARMNAGLEIIDTLSRHFGISLPVVVDGGESYVKLIDIAPQIIKVSVSEKDKTLRVEVA